MPMTDVSDAPGTLSDKHSLGQDLVAAEDPSTKGMP